VDGNQTLFVRFFARDHADLVIENRRKLKGTTCVVFEDTTMANRRLLNALKRLDSVVVLVITTFVTGGATCWCASGCVGVPLCHQMVKAAFGDSKVGEGRTSLGTGEAGCGFLEENSEFVS
jgi:hypothetical protein